MRGDTRSALCLTRVSSSVQTSVKKPGKGQSNQAQQFGFFLNPQQKKMGRDDREAISSSLLLYVLVFFKRFPDVLLETGLKYEIAHLKA